MFFILVSCDRVIIFLLFKKCIFLYFRKNNLVFYGVKGEELDQDECEQLIKNIMNTYMQVNWRHKLFLILKKKHVLSTNLEDSRFTWDRHVSCCLYKKPFFKKELFKICKNGSKSNKSSVFNAYFIFSKEKLWKKLKRNRISMTFFCQKFVSNFFFLC